MNELLSNPMTWEFRWIPAALMALAGLAIAERGVLQCVRGAKTPNGVPGKNLTWMRGFRGVIQGGSLAAAGAGWYFGWPVMIAAAAIIILEETRPRLQPGRSARSSKPTRTPRRPARARRYAPRSTGQSSR